jgi:hypothetical protein
MFLVFIVHHATGGSGKELSKLGNLPMTKLYSPLLTFYYFPAAIVFLLIVRKNAAFLKEVTAGPV